METSFADRVRQFRQHKGLSQKAFADQCGLEQGNITQMERGTEPKQSNVSKLLSGFPDLNPDWLLTDNGPMTRDGRTLTPIVMKADSPVVQAKEPPADYTSGPATEQTLYISVLKEQVADLKADKVRLIQENEQLRKKSSDSPDAAGPIVTPPTPQVPTPGCGFMTAARKAELAAEFNRYIEEMEKAEVESR